jgi:hypothetical protein
MEGGRRGQAKRKKRGKREREGQLDPHVDKPCIGHEML